MPVPVFEVLEILLCKILIFAHFQVPIEGTSTSATEEFSMAKWPLASLLMILPSKKNFLSFVSEIQAIFWSPKIEVCKYGISWSKPPRDLEIVPMNAGHMVYL